MCQIVKNALSRSVEKCFKNSQMHIQALMASKIYRFCSVVAWIKCVIIENAESDVVDVRPGLGEP